MLAVLTQALVSVALRMFQTIATEVMVEWLVLKVGKIVVKSTKNTLDDEFYNKLVELLKKEEAKDTSKV